MTTEKCMKRSSKDWLFNLPIYVWNIKRCIRFVHLLSRCCFFCSHVVCYFLYCSVLLLSAAILLLIDWLIVGLLLLYDSVRRRRWKVEIWYIHWLLLSSIVALVSYEFGLRSSIGKPEETAAAVKVFQFRL